MAFFPRSKFVGFLVAFGLHELMESALHASYHPASVDFPCAYVHRSFVKERAALFVLIEKLCRSYV